MASRRATAKSRLRGIAPWVLVLFWSGLVLTADLVFCVTTWRQHEATRFAVTTGKIAQSGLGQGALGRRGLRLRYTYGVNGVKYSGSRYRYDDDNVSLRYDKVLEQYPAHTSHKVYYDPSNPRDSVLSPGVDGCDFLLMLVATPFNIVALAVWSALLGARRKQGAGNFAGVKVMRGERRVVVRFVVMSPLEAGLYGLGAAAMLEATVVILKWGFTESIPLMAGSWAVALAVGGACAFWKQVKNKSGACDLVIDPEQLTLPLLEGARGRPMARAALAAVTALRRVSKTRSGTHYSYVPALVSAEGRAAPLVRWGWSEEKALAFGQWLAGELGVHFQGLRDEAQAAPVSAAA